MCGIFSYVQPRRLDEAAILRALQSRGPDAHGAMTLSLEKSRPDQVCSLLHTRLSIIDLSEEANQPMVDATGRYTIVFNGEIYNFRELRDQLRDRGHSFRTHSDTEVLLEGYKEWGKGVLDHLRGMFAFCIHDEKKQSLFLARDHFGMKPLYYLQDGPACCFSSTVQAILASDVRPGYTLDREAIGYYAAFGAFQSPDTIFREIRSLPPAHWIEYHDGELQIQRYWNPAEPLRDADEPVDTIRNRLRPLLFECVEKHLIADVPVGIFLSGGIDSSLIAGIASKVSNAPIHTFSIGLGKGMAGTDESKVAARTAKFLGAEHETILLGSVDFESLLQEFIDAIDMPSTDGLNAFLISRAIEHRVKVVLAGLGGDEMFAGYPVFHHVAALQKSPRWAQILRHLPAGVLYRIGKPYLRHAGQSLFDVLLAKRARGGLTADQKKRMRSLYIENEQILKTVSIFEIFGYMANTLLRDTDALTMSQSLEARTPFVDKDVYAFAMSVADRYKMVPGINKGLLVETFRDLLPEETYRLPKRGFTVPLDSWLAGYLTKNRQAELREVYHVFSLSPQMNPFSEQRTIKNRRDLCNVYRWIILLAWIQQHSCFY